MASAVLAKTGRHFTWRAASRASAPVQMEVRERPRYRTGMMLSARVKLILALLPFALVVAGELAVRGLIDIKLYGADGEVGYWTLPDQRGGAALTGSYAYNAQGFGVARPFDPSGSQDLILVGDSIVAGTSAIDQHQRLGEVLGRESGWQVWPLATGSWALANQLRALKRVDLAGVEAIVFLLNPTDFGAPSAWRSEYDLPRSPPRSYLLQALRKHMPFLRSNDQPIAVRPADLPVEWAAFRAASEIPVIIVAYESDGTGTSCEWVPAWLGPPATCIDLVAMGYRHALVDVLHPTPEGNAVIAQMVARPLGNIAPVDRLKVLPSAHAMVASTAAP